MKKYNFFNILIILTINTLIIIFFDVTFHESQKSWVAERIFTENNRFLNFTYGPIYLIYLKIIRFLVDYPHFIKVELLISSTIFLISFYKFINIFFKKAESLFITIPIIPIVLLIESRQNLLASALFIIYMINLSKEKKLCYLPLSLLISALIARTFVPLLFLNIFFCLILNKKFPKFKIKKIKYYIKLLLICFATFSYNFQWEDPKNNHMLYDTTYSPNIDYNNPLEIGFFQFSNQRIANSKDDGKTDWYLNFNKNFNNNNSLKKVLLNEPKIIFDSIIYNIPPFIYVISKTILSAGYIILPYKIKIFTSFIIIIIILFGLFLIFRGKFSINNKIVYLPVIFYLPIFVSSLLITNPTFRYFYLILPIFMIIFYIPIKFFLKRFFFTFIILSCVVNFYFNLNYYNKFIRTDFQKTEKIQLFLDDQKGSEIKIITNEKNLLTVINNENKIYIGFDSIPPYFDKKIKKLISESNYVIFNDSAKSYDDISTKTGKKYSLYIDPLLNDKNWKQEKIDDFYVLKNRLILN